MADVGNQVHKNPPDETELLMNGQSTEKTPEGKPGLFSIALNVTVKLCSVVGLQLKPLYAGRILPRTYSLV